MYIELSAAPRQLHAWAVGGSRPPRQIALVVRPSVVQSDCVASTRLLDSPATRWDAG